VRPSGFASTIAALEARSPWLASRGGSTMTRSRSASVSPSKEAALTAAFTRPVKSLKIFMKENRLTPSAVRHPAGARQLNQFRRLVKQAEVLRQRIAVGHAGDEIGDAAGGAVVIVASARPPFGRQALGLRQVAGIELLDQPLGAPHDVADPRNAI